MNQVVQRPLTVSRWTLQTTVGWFIGFVLIISLGIVSENAGIGDQSIVGIAMGFGVGFMQWFLLKKISPIGKSWMWFSTMGLSVPFILYDILGPQFNLRPESALPFATALGALLAGWLQYRYILAAISPKSKRWIVYNCIGWLIPCLLAMSLDLVNRIHPPEYIGIPLAFIFILGGGPILGLLTGRTIVAILSLSVMEKSSTVG